MRCASTLIFGLALLQPTVPALAREVVRPDLSGHWVLATDRSKGSQEAGPGHFKGRGRAGGGDGFGRRPSGAGEGDPSALREQMATLERAAAELEIRRAESGFVIRDGLGLEWPATADGREQTVVGADQAETFVRSEWDDRGRLKIWRVRAGALTTEETLELTEDDDALLVETRISGGRRGDRTLTRFYARAPAAGEASSSPEDEPAGAPNG